MSSSSFIISNDANGTFTIPFATIENTLTSLSLFGRGVGNYAQPFAQNELNLLTNFASPNSPINPLLGQIWYNSTTQLLNYYISPNTWNQVASQQWVEANYATLAELSALANSDAAQFANLQQEITNLSNKEANDINAVETWVTDNFTTKVSLFNPPAGSSPVAIGAGGTGLTTIGTPGQMLEVNSTGNGLTYFTPSTQMVTSFNGRVGAILLQSVDVTNALGFTPPSITGAGAYGNWNINAASASKVNNNLTNGAYINGSAYNGSAPVTWSVNATSGNAGNTVVARDGSGNFAANYINSQAYIELSGRQGIPAQICMRDQSWGRISYFDNTDPDSGIFNYTLQMDGGMYSFNFSTAAVPYDIGSTKASIDYNGSIWGAGNLSVNGAIYAGGDITAFTSDERLKHEIYTIDNALNLTKQLRGVRYKRKDIENHRGNIGFIAQEIQKVIPEVVHEGDDGYLKVAYQNVVGLLVEAVKELSDQVDALKQEINSMKGDAK